MVQLTGKNEKETQKEALWGLHEMCPITCLITCCTEANHSQSPSGVTEKRYTLNARFPCYHTLGKYHTNKS